MTTDGTTQSKILHAALELTLQKGIKKTDLTEVAYQAGVTRVTIYRYFKNKHDLIQSALLLVPDMLENIQERITRSSPLEFENSLDLLAAGFNQLPKGDLPRLLEETRRVYPDIFKSLHIRRIAAIQGIVNQLLDLAEAQGKLRLDLNRDIIQSYFLTSIANVLEDPLLESSGFSADEIFKTVKTIFLHGILKE